jgi:hypothetical protein
MNSKIVTVTARLSFGPDHVNVIESWIGQELVRSHGRVRDERILFAGNQKIKRTRLSGCAKS